MNDEEAAVFIGLMLVVGAIMLLVFLAIQAFICWLNASFLKRIPEPFREQTPGMVWLLMIPCFPVIWNFFVYPRIAASFQNYFNEHDKVPGRPDVGDCGASLAQYFCIAAICSVVPVLNYIAGPASLVLLILILVKFHTLKGMIPEDAADTAAEYYE